MLVRATKRGNYGIALREPGDVFKLKPYEGVFPEYKTDARGKVVSTKNVKRLVSAQEQFSENWMEEVEPQEAKAAGKRGRGNNRSEPVGERPPPEDPNVLAQRLADADEMFEESRAEDAEVI